MVARSGWRRLRFRHPAQVVVTGFAVAIVVGSLLLMLPGARTDPGGAEVLQAVFTATSAVCVTGLTVVDTQTYWTGLGQAVILALIQVGGFGIMTFASLLGVLISRRMGLRARLTAAAETKTLGLGEVRAVVAGVVKVSLLLEAVTALALTLRFGLGYDEPWPRAVWLGVFHAVSAFNNAGFALYTDNLMGFATDPWICLPIAFAVIAGGLGFPVLFELRRRLLRPRRWSLHTKIVLWTSGIFLSGGTVFITAIEWSNPATLGPMDVPGKLLAGFFQGGAMPRTAGFNSLDIGQMNPASWLGMDVLMFVGGASAGTAGGIKVTTFAVLLFVIYAEVRGEGAVNIFNRRLHGDVQRQALTVVLLAVAAVVGSTVVFMVFTDINLDRSLFEVTSAFATVGLTTGITGDLPAPEQILLVVLMFLGRLGPITVASALALRQRVRMYDLPEERPVIG
ncbi:potassium transporter TrkG [Streptomyces sp. TRM 70361]|uniref:TrkH family potassium uptake protein n=1 Tax=Streptomyces sp. TRM 70361 TaxID=3116553 RepID=UPI002E7AD882|nr:potassium transporter TrkG [Streptomyces sp. TRM 70361]MEE1942278.1 potassium transporter TrkG [Streptomyces sp. TRM 70361]